MKLTTVFANLGLLALTTQLSVAQVKKNSFPPLDSKYSGLKAPTKVSGRGLPSSSPTEKLIKYQTEVKSQAHRGTCSIFSATALLESMLILRKAQPVTINLSEEWMQYAISKGKIDDGSNTVSNFAAIVKYGIPYETTFPYIGATWTDLNSDPRAKERCGHLTGNLQKSCLTGHWDTSWIDLKDSELKAKSDELFQAREEAQDLQKKLLSGLSTARWIPNTAQVKQLLNQGVPLNMSTDFYYGAWNHGAGNGLGIDLDLSAWARGEVGYPEPNSVDYEKSQTKPAGHSILIVGYDDNVVIERTMNIKTPRLDARGNPVKDASGKAVFDIKPKKFSYKGVYYFKNSWGVGNFGTQTKIGSGTYPGYGMITQKYAEEYGSFYQISIR